MKDKGLTKKHLCSLMTLFIITGCIIPPKKLADDKLSGIKKIVVVPVEPPPLNLGSGFVEALSDVPIISGYPPEGALVLQLIAGIVVFSQKSKYEEKHANVLKLLKEWYANDQIWIPTRILAQEAANQISQAVNIQVIVRQELLSIPVKKKEMTWHMENWVAPIREWYKQDVSTINTEEYQRQGVDAIIEVGILNYDIYQRHLLLQVLTKLVSVPSGKVEARSGQIGDPPPPIGPPEELFRNNGELFKKVFMIEGKKILNYNLREMGLLP